MSLLKNSHFYLMVLFAFLCLLSPEVFANTAGSDLPWEDPISKLSTSLSGPIAYGVATIALIATFSGLAFGGEMSDVMKRTTYITMVLAVLLMANAILQSLFTGQGALI